MKLTLLGLNSAMEGSIVSSSILTLSILTGLRARIQWRPLPLVSRSASSVKRAPVVSVGEPRGGRRVDRDGARAYHGTPRTHPWRWRDVPHLGDEPTMESA